MNVFEMSTFEEATTQSSSEKSGIVCGERLHSNPTPSDGEDAQCIYLMKSDVEQMDRTSTYVWMIIVPTCTFNLLTGGDKVVILNKFRYGYLRANSAHFFFFSIRLPYIISTQFCYLLEIKK